MIKKQQTMKSLFVCAMKQVFDLRQKKLLLQCSLIPRQKRLDEMALADEQIKTIKTKTLLFHGLNDQVIPIEHTSYQLIQLLPHAELHVFNECGHWTQIEKTEPFIDHILAFIKN